MSPRQKHRLLARPEPIEREEPRVVRWFPWIIITLGLFAVAAAMLLTRQVGEAETERVTATATALSLADQINAECAAGRLAGAICTQAEQVPDVVTPPAAAAILVPVPGEDGIDGVTPPCLFEPGQCRGQDGVSVTGVPGTPGRDGADGKDGINGTDGSNGTSGSPAQTVVESNTDGSSRTCEREPGSPNTAPTYTCVSSPAPTTDPPAEAP